MSINQNLSFYTVIDPPNDIVGTPPYRVSSPASAPIAQPPATISEIGDTYAYFSVTERELLALTEAGDTLKEQLEKVLAVRLQLMDGSTHRHEGKTDVVSDIIDQSTGPVGMRAILSNEGNVS